MVLFRDEAFDIKNTVLPALAVTSNYRLATYQRKSALVNTYWWSGARGSSDTASTASHKHSYLKNKKTQRLQVDLQVVNDYTVAHDNENGLLHDMYTFKR